MSNNIPDHVATNLVTDCKSLDDFMNKYYKDERYKGRGKEYAQTLLNNYRHELEQRGYTWISHHDSKTGKAVYFAENNNNLTIRLQSVGVVNGNYARDIKAGHKLMWNFGQTSTVKGITKETEKSIWIDEQCDISGNIYNRRMLKTRIVCIIGK